MNENLDLTKILEGCPEGTEFYSSVFGEVRFIGINTCNEYPIKLQAYNKYTRSLEKLYFSKEGNPTIAYKGECTLFPSKDQRDWSKFERFWDKPKSEKFDPKTLHPFDKVLARCTGSVWVPTLFGYFIDEADKDPLSPFENGERVVCVDIGYHQCIPYNEETKHLVGTLDDCPEYYKWWEE